MKLRALIITAGITSFFLLSCSQTEKFAENESFSQDQPVDTSAYISGVMNVRVSESLYGRVAVSDEAATEAFKAVGATSVRRLFPDNGFPERTRKAGLHLWYHVEYDDSIPMTKAYDDIGNMDGVEYVEYCPKIYPIGKTAGSVGGGMSTNSVSNALPFNDPRLNEQWHYYNDGTTSGAVSGCDINVVPVWEKYTTGNQDVIVAVIDEGVDFDHEDLAANMWNNPEQTGSKVYGYNFVDNNFIIVPGDHGTHVAGTIAAVNNNGKGVCGIAGGDAKNGVPGVKIMSCQIFKGEEGGSGPEAIKWAADHGAVIAQNSWGYNLIYVHETPEADKKAIDYFNTYAGKDKNGNQTGPMAGGIVIFAAGNDDCEQGYPADYEGAVAVTALGSNFKKASYSTYGNWTDIAAPGGNISAGNKMVLSTLDENKYGYMEGTSMACPHVSGVAALVISKFAGIGFSADVLKESLLKNVRDISSYNPTYKGKLGSGLVDALKALTGIGGTTPNPVTEINLSATSNLILASVKVPKDKQTGKAFGITLYYSKKPITTSSSAEDSVNFETGDVKVGEFLDCPFAVPEFSTTYYVEAKSYGISGMKSSLSKLNKSVKTGENIPPVIKPVSGEELTVGPYETGTLSFIITDADGHDVSASLVNDNPAIKLIQINDSLFNVTVEGAKSKEGTFSPKLVASDGFGGESSLTLKMTVKENHAPTLIKNIPDIVFGAVGEKRTFTLSEYFTDEDGETLTYQVTTDASLCHLSESEGILYVTSMAYGTCAMSVTAVDGKNASCTSSFNELTRDNSVELDIYPVPVKDGKLYFRCSEERSASVEMFSSSGARVLNENIKITPFSPACINISALAGGTYKCKVNFDNGKVVEKSIIKL